MAEVVEVTIGQKNPCPSCGNKNTRLDDYGMFRIYCASCGGDILSFGKPITREVELTVTPHEDGSATIEVGR